MSKTRGEWIRCSNCGGTGLVSIYSGFEFEGPKECPRCSQGFVWRYQSGAIAQFPSGPFVGHATAAGEEPEP